MKATGVTRPIDPLGRVVIPKELRKQLNWNEEDRVEFFIENDSVIIRKYAPVIIREYAPGCHCCGEVKGLTKVLDFNICPKCLKEFKKASELINGSRKVGD